MTTELPILYINHKGESVRTGSYSAREEYTFCPEKFNLHRRQGYSEKISRISLQFGKCVEAGVAAFHNNNLRKGAAVEMFTTLWEKLKTTKDFDEFTYSKKEHGFDELWRMGREMMALYEAVAPSLPIREPQFQVNAKKEIFPKTELAGLWNTAYLDILSKAPWDHPLLPKVEGLVGVEDTIRPLIIDVKTSGVELREDLVGLDPQLREYAWQRRIPDVAFLWFQKMGLSISKGDLVSSLENGQKYIVASVEKDVNGNPENVRVFPSAASMQKFQETAKAIFDDRALAIEIIDKEEVVFDAALKGLRGKVREALKAEQEPARVDLSSRKEVVERDIAERHDAALAAAGMLVLPVSSVTKQRIQFAAARLTQKEMDDAGKHVGQTTVQMVHSEKTNYFPQTGGIRWPHNPCVMCCMQGLCANKPELVAERLVKSGEEWLEGLEEAA